MRNYINKVLITPIIILTFLLNPLLAFGAINTLGSFDSGDGSSSSSSRADVQVSKYTTGSIGGTVTQGRMRVRISSAGSAASAMVIYSDSSGDPGTLLATSDERIITATSLTDTTYIFSGQNKINLQPNTSYYVGIHNADPGTPSFGVGLLGTAGASDFSWYNYNDTYPGAETTFSNEDEFNFTLLNLDLTYESPEGVSYGLINSSLAKSGLSLDHDGVDEAAKSINDPTFSSNTAGTISCWVNPDTVLSGNGVRAIFGAGGEDTDEATNFGVFFIGLRYLTTGSHFNRIEWQHRVDGSATLNRVVGNTALSADTWYLITVSSSGTAVKIYVNSTLQTLTTISGSNTGDWFGDIGTVGTDISAIGNTYRDGAWGASYWDGNIDECSVWSSQLTDANITTLYNGGKPILPQALGLGTNLVSHWKLGEDENATITTMFDSVGDNNFTTVNMETADIVRNSFY